MPRRSCRFILHLSSFLILLAACAPVDSSATPPNITEATPSSTAATSLTPVPLQTSGVDASSLRGITIMVWHPWFNVEASLLEAQVAEFNSTNEWDISVLTASQSNYTELFNNVSGALALPDRPDVVIGLPEHALAWDTQNGVVDLSPYLADPKWGLTVDEIADFPPVFWKQDEVGGRRLGMPAQRTTRLLFYNKTWARELGFTTPPETPEEFEKQACAANAVMRANGDATDDGFGGWYLDTDPLTALSWMLAFDGGAQEGESYHFLTHENIEAFRFVKTLFERGCAFGPVSVSPAESFAARRALFVAGGLEEMSTLTRALHTRASTDEWTVLPFPGGNREGVIIHGSSFIMLPSTEEEQLAAWLFIRWIISPETQAEWVQATGLFPLRNSTLTRVADYASTHPQWVEAVKLIPRGRGTPQLASWRQVRAALGDGFAFMFRVDEQAPSILADLDRVVQDLVR